MSLRYTPVPVSVFQKELLKGPNIGARLLSRMGNFVKPKPKATESDIYPILCKALNAVLNLAGGKFTFKDVAHWAESGDIDHRPDLAMYPTHPQAAAAYTLDAKAKSRSKAAKSRKPHIARCAYQWMLTAIEVKLAGKECGFGFKPGEPLLRAGDDAVTARAQFSTYAAEIMLRQHRTHLFMFYIAGSYARIFRWDRNGAVVSHPIDLATDFKQLLNSVYRLAQADETLQGFDTTASLATADEIEELRRYNPTNTWLQGYKSLMLDNIFQHPIFKIECDEILQSNGNRRSRASRRKRFLVGKPVSGGYQPVGRCTKAWVCYCLDDNTMAFMKEQWRANAVGVHPEIATYSRLREHGVEHVATAVAGGDVSDAYGVHKTVSQRFFDKQGLDMSERIQTRLVIKEVGRSLETYDASPELIIVTTDALLGHQQAWEKAGVLHRDVSVGNILIDVASPEDDIHGFLTDWDLCQYREELGNQTAPSQKGVSGTWAFGSALSLQYPKKPKELADDMESFVYVVSYCAFRWHRHNLSSGNVDDLIKATPDEQARANRENSRLALAKHHFFYEEADNKNGIFSGGAQKLTHITSGSPPIQLDDQGSPLHNLLSRLYKLLQGHYTAVDMAALTPYLAVAPRPSPPQQTPSSGSSSPGVYMKLRSAAANVQSTVSRSTASSSSRKSSAARSASSSGNASCTGTLSSVPASCRTMDDHTAIQKIFFSVLQDAERRPLNVKKYMHDKVYDQFNDNVVILEGHIKDPSNGSDLNVPGGTSAGTAGGAATAKSTAGKRKSSELSEPAPDPRPARKVKKPKTVNHGMLRPVLATGPQDRKEHV